MFDPFKKLKLAGAFLGVAADESAAGAPEGLDISELFGRLSLKDLRGMTLPADLLLEQPGVRALYESRYMPEPEPLDRLTALGEGTLGFEYARYLRQSKLPQPTPSRRIDYSDPAAYLAERVRMTHPLLHLIAEYDATPLGELALQAYYIGQTGNLISGVIISSALLQITRDTPDQLGAALEVTSEAFQRGKVARSFLGIAWEELWSAQVPQLRELIEIPARSSAVALLRFVAPTPPAPEPRASRSGSFSAFSNSEDGFAALGRANSGSSSSSTSRHPRHPHPRHPRHPHRPPTPRRRAHATSPASAARPSSPTPTRRASPPRPPAPRLRGLVRRARSPARARPRPRRCSPASWRSRSRPPTPSRHRRRRRRRRPPPPPQPPPPQPRPPRVETRAPAKQPPPAPPPRPGEPGYKIEEAEKNITPALSPDDPDYF